MPFAWRIRKRFPDGRARIQEHAETGIRMEIVNGPQYAEGGPSFRTPWGFWWVFAILKFSDPAGRSGYACWIEDHWRFAGGELRDVPFIDVAQTVMKETTP